MPFAIDVDVGEKRVWAERNETKRNETAESGRRGPAKDRVPTDGRGRRRAAGIGAGWGGMMRGRTKTERRIYRI